MRVLIHASAALAAVALATTALTATAWAATPASTATCTGSLTPDSSGASSGEPNLLDYSFSCSADVSTYTFVVTRDAAEPNTIDNFEPSPVVNDSSNNPSSTESFLCSGAIPGNGFNCNAPTGTPMTAGYSANGSLDPIDEYCKHLPTGGKPGTPAIPRLQVQVIVTDVSGASDGPFRLSFASSCPSVPDTVPAPPPPRHRPVHRCSGKLGRDHAATSAEPNLLDYRFKCDAPVAAYTLLVTHQAGQTQTINEFDRNPLVLQPGGAPSPTESFSCGGAMPGLGFDCTAGANGQMSAGNSARGSFNPVHPYCGRGSSGSNAQAEQQAQVELLVSDETGALRGPFELALTHKCSTSSHSSKRAQH
jgi:hypothetical protein